MTSHNPTSPLSPKLCFVACRSVSAAARVSARRNSMHECIGREQRSGDAAIPCTTPTASSLHARGAAPRRLRGGCVVTTVRRRVCSREKSSKRDAKSRVSAAARHGSKNAKAECDGGGRALSHSSFLFFVRSHGQQVASTPLAALVLPPQQRHVEWCRTSVATLLLLSFDSIYTAGKPPAAQAIKPAHIIDPIHAPTRVLAYLARDTQRIDWRANSSIDMVLQGPAYWHWHVMSTCCAWEAI